MAYTEKNSGSTHITIAIDLPERSHARDMELRHFSVSATAHPSPTPCMELASDDCAALFGCRAHSPPYGIALCPHTFPKGLGEEKHASRNKSHEHPIPQKLAIDRNLIEYNEYQFARAIWTISSMSATKLSLLRAHGHTYNIRYIPSSRN